MSGGDEFEARLAKAAGMRARGDEPYPVRFDRTHTTGEVREHWADRLGDGDSTDDTDHDERSDDDNPAHFTVWESLARRFPSLWTLGSFQVWSVRNGERWRHDGYRGDFSRRHRL